MKKPAHPEPGLVIGWREWVALPGLGIRAVKAKVDTGARSSALHAIDVETYERQGEPRVRFRVHPRQHDARVTVAGDHALAGWRRVRSSSGHTTLRPMIVTELRLGGSAWAIELTLVGRDEMGFRMLLGREALRGRAVVDPRRSFLTGRPPRKATGIRTKAKPRKPAGRAGAIGGE